AASHVRICGDVTLSFCGVSPPFMRRASTSDPGRSQELCKGHAFVASRPVDHRDAADAARRLSGVVMSIAGTARGMGRKARKAVGTLRRLIVPPEPEGVPVEIVLDTGAYLNWCSERDVIALVLTPGAPDGDGAELTSPAIDAAGPRHGLVDLR